MCGFIWTLFSIFVFDWFIILMLKVSIYSISLLSFADFYFKISGILHKFRYVNVNSGLAMMWQCTKKIGVLESNNTNEIFLVWNFSFLCQITFFHLKKPEKNYLWILCEEPSIFAIVYTLLSYTIQNNDRT